MVAYAAITPLAGARFGYLDRLLNNPIAAGQFVQFALISILTLGLFPAGYLAMYYGGRRFIAKQQERGRHSRHRSH